MDEAFLILALIYMRGLFSFCSVFVQFFRDQTPNNTSHIRRKWRVFVQFLFSCSVFVQFLFSFLWDTFDISCSALRLVHSRNRHVFCVALRSVHSGCRLFLFSYLCLLLFLLGCFFWWVCYHLYYPPYFLLAFWMLVYEHLQSPSVLRLIRHKALLYLPS